VFAEYCLVLAPEERNVGSTRAKMKSSSVGAAFVSLSGARSYFGGLCYQHVAPTELDFVSADYLPTFRSSGARLDFGGLCDQHPTPSALAAALQAPIKFHPVPKLNRDLVLRFRIVEMCDRFRYGEETMHIVIERIGEQFLRHIERRSTRR